MSPENVNPWTPEMEIDLLRVWNLGKTARETMIEINYLHSTSFSRSAIVGKISRMRAKGLVAEKRPNPVNLDGAEKKRRSRIVAKQRREKERAMKDQEATEENPLFSEVGSKQCRYPLWTDTTPAKQRRVCGCQTRSGTESFCEEHRKMCWSKDKPKPTKGGLSLPTIKAIKAMARDGVSVATIARAQAVTLEQAHYYAVRSGS
jgi:hypothetical protein